MSDFDLKIRYPHHIGLNELEAVGALDLVGILSQFDKMKWRHQLVRQLQLDGVNPSFIITDEQTKQTLQVVLDSYNSSEQLIFKLQTDIPVIVPRKQIFGLVTRKSQKMIKFPELSLAQVKAYLVAFLKRDIAVLENHYQQGLQELSTVS